ncbi:MAG TPA: DUF6282 family protein [Anaeromyxobacteraceae bacterium]|jgi:hypothetical protein|nr:DUF6282 family protein [Anaeromyxobacteraceae bacterium]
MLERSDDGRPFRIPRWKLTPCCALGAHAAAGPRAAVAPASGSPAADPPAAPAGRQYPPPPPAVSPVEGLIDLHVHSAPDVFGRALDDEDAARTFRDRGLEAFAIKGHTTVTADRAWLARRHVQGIGVYGGVVLNGAAGGLNPEAVEWMARVQGSYGRLVWFPTFDADHHVRHFRNGPSGIGVLDAEGRVLPAARRVLEACARQTLVVCTGHLSAAESLAVVRAAREVGCERISVTHAMMEVPGFTLEQLREAAGLGAKLELAALGLLMGPDAHLAWMREWRRVTHADMAAAIRAIGARHFHLSTDLGQTGNPVPADGYALLVEGLLAEGITRDEIRVMGREVPGALLLG